MKKKLILASRNRGKIDEIKTMLDGLPLELLSLNDFPELPAVEEDEDTFAGNARKKAETIALACGCAALADDSGLEVECLNGRPGVYSARFAGPQAGDAENNRYLLSLMRGVPPEKRSATFRCVIALALPEGKTYLVEGSCRGRIAEELRGDSGFGYDPLFIVEPSGLTFAQMGPDEKNKISHRARALRKLRALLENLFATGPNLFQSTAEKNGKA